MSTGVAYGRGQEVFFPNAVSLLEDGSLEFNKFQNKRKWKISSLKIDKQ